MPTIAVQHIKTSWLIHISCMHKSSSRSGILFSTKQGLELSALRAVVRGHLCDKWGGRCSPWAIRTLCSHQATQDLRSLQAMSVIYTYWQIKVSHCMCLGPFNIQRNAHALSIACWFFLEECLSWEWDYIFKWMASIYAIWDGVD